MDKSSALKLLTEFGAPDRLMRHVSLVSEASDMLITKFSELKIPIDINFVEAGVVFHDVGKIEHDNELSEAGDAHESAGELLLLKSGVPSDLARVCRSHAQWSKMVCTIEELIIALSDKLWKGKRVDELEQRIIKHVSESLGREYWDLFQELDSCFEEVAELGDDRLHRSRI